MLLYPARLRAQAVKLAKEWRSDTRCVELILRQEDISLEDYLAYAGRNGATEVYDLENEREFSL